MNSLDRKGASKDKEIGILGEVSEWSNEAVLKTVVRRAPWVRILPSPPNSEQETCLRGRKEQFAKLSYG